MKKLIVLPGNSVSNQAWGEAAAEYFGDWFREVYLQYYDHWESGEANINLESELVKLKEVVIKDDVETEYVIVAKSIGSILALLAIHLEIINPEKCVFFGMPLDLAAADIFKDNWSALSDLKVPTLSFHNEADPTANFHFTKNILTAHAPAIKLVARSGNNHNYDEFAEFEPAIKEFLNQ